MMRPHRSSRASRAAFTLLELLVVLAILAAAALTAGLALRSAPVSGRAGLDAQLTDLRRRAVETGETVSAVLADSSGAYAAVARPDGSVIADPALHVDRLTGRRTP